MLKYNDKKMYIAGEIFIRTPKNLYCIKSYNMIFSNKMNFDYYIKVKSYSTQKGKTNSFTHAQGNSLLSDFRQGEHPLFNRIKENTRLYKALKKRISF